MLRNYFKIAFRSLTRNKAFSFINIFGLAVGLATCLLIMLYIFDESSYDQHHKDGDRLFRIASETGKGETWAAAPAPMAWALKNDLPEVEQATRLMTFPDIEKMLVKYKNQSESKQFFETNGYYVDSIFFQLFTYDFIYGNAATALEEPNTMVLSVQLAGKFFGKENPVGKAMQIVTPFGEFNYTVKGVFDNTKHKSHIPANYFLSMRNKDMWNWVQNQTSWTTNNVFFTYVKLKGSASQAGFERKLKPFFEGYAGEGMKAAGFSKSLFVQPVKSIYLHSSIGNEIAPNGNITYLYILGSIAVFILLIACINFMNLSTARSQKRAKEVGVRKVIGAEKSSLIRQFLGESFLMCLIALGFALILVWMLLPLFNNLTHKNMHPLDEPVLLWWAVGLTLLTGLLAGLYPMLFYAEGRTVSDVMDVHLSAIDDDFIGDLGIKLLSGRSFSKQFRADSASIILNEEAVKQLGYTVENAVGKKVQYDFKGHSTLQIVGVVKNFNFESLHKSIKPFGFTTGMFSSKYAYLIASITTNDYSGLLSDLEKSWAKLNPETPFVYLFPDQNFQRQYEREQRTASLVIYFTLIAILIACLGLFGLAAFSAEQRTKEIGIRKVLGASVTNVTLLLSKDFISLVIIAILIASPLAWYGMNKWLQDLRTGLRYPGGCCWLPVCWLS